MIMLILGGSGCGKSSFAEKQIVSMGGELYYLATMQVYGKEGEEKVKRHRLLRKDKGFETIEQQTDIYKAEKQMRGDNSSVLVECMSNLLANEMFREEEIISAEVVSKKIVEDCKKLALKVQNLVIVSNNVFEDGVCYDKETRAYQKALGRINCELSRMADEVYELVVGIPIKIK